MVLKVAILALFAVGFAIVVSGFTMLYVLISPTYIFPRWISEYFSFYIILSVSAIIVLAFRGEAFALVNKAVSAAKLIQRSANKGLEAVNNSISETVEQIIGNNAGMSQNVESSEGSQSSKKKSNGFESRSDVEILSEEQDQDQQDQDRDQDQYQKEQNETQENLGYSTESQKEQDQDDQHRNDQHRNDQDQGIRNPEKPLNVISHAQAEAVRLFRKRFGLNPDITESGPVLRSKSHSSKEVKSKISSHTIKNQAKTKTTTTTNTKIKNKAKSKLKAKIKAKVKVKGKSTKSKTKK